MEKVKRESGEVREMGKLTIVELQILTHGSRRLVHGYSGGELEARALLAKVH